MKPSTSPEPAAASPADDTTRTRLLHLFRASVREGRVHPLMPLVLKYRAGQRSGSGRP